MTPQEIIKELETNHRYNFDKNHRKYYDMLVLIADIQKVLKDDN